LFDNYVHGRDFSEGFGFYKGSACLRQPLLIVNCFTR
jgi:hypothetical protein